MASSSYLCGCRVVSEVEIFSTRLSLVTCMMMLTKFDPRISEGVGTIWRTLLTTCATCITPILYS